jgi:hypothetical protein
MLDVQKIEELDIPEGVEVTVKSRIISVTGSRGTLTKNVRHVNMDIRVVKGQKPKVLLTVWQGGRKHVACLRTIRTMINNMIIGVTKVRAIIRGFLGRWRTNTPPGLPLQDAYRLCPFPHQLHHQQQRRRCRDP